MQLPRPHITVRQMMVVVAGLAFLFFFVAREIEKQRVRTEYRREYGRFVLLLQALDRRAPQGIYRPAWDDAIQLIFQTSYGSGLSGSRRGALQLKLLCDDLEKKLSGDVGPETLCWLWGRFAETGEAGRRSTGSCREWFGQCIQRLENLDGKRGGVGLSPEVP